jgi:hypothetical protein
MLFHRTYAVETNTVGVALRIAATPRRSTAQLQQILN